MGAAGEDAAGGGCVGGCEGCGVIRTDKHSQLGLDLPTRVNEVMNMQSI